MTGLAVLGGQTKLSTEDRQILWNSYLPWAAKTGLRCADLMSIYYEHHFEEDLQELRTRWRITPAPPPPQHLATKLNQAAAGAGADKGGAADEGGTGARMAVAAAADFAAIGSSSSSSSSAGGGGSRGTAAGEATAET